MTFLSTMTIARMFMFDGSGHGYYLKWCFVFMLNWVIFWKPKDWVHTNRQPPSEGPNPLPQSF